MSYFSTIYSDNSLPVRAKTVYMYLRDRSDKERKCWPGINTIAAELGKTRAA
jgi:GntR family transcriptional regulator